MAYSCIVVADSVSEAGARLTTLEVTLPRIVLAEFNTHRVFSRNSASSRAIPVAKQIARIKEDPFIPEYWGANQSGMQAAEELDSLDRMTAEVIWLQARDEAIRHVERLLELGLHKQITNRILEPWMWQTILVTATEWSNFFALRANPDAQPEIRRAAELMRQAMEESAPKHVAEGEWHLPLVGFVPPRSRFETDKQYEAAERAAGYELEWARREPVRALKVSVGRCARVSYLTHDGQRDFGKDVELYERLVSSGHMSPTEHVATPFHYRPGTTDFGEEFPLQPEWSGNFRGWKQYRKILPGEDDFSKVTTAKAK